MAASTNKKKRRKFIVDKQTKTPYHLKARSTNLEGKLLTKIILILMVVGMIVLPIIGVLIYLV